jgi:hypothetical protein
MGRSPHLSLRSAFTPCADGYMTAVARLLGECSHPGCRTLTMGELCVAHEEPMTRTFVRGRPWPPPVAPAGLGLDPTSASLERPALLLAADALA